MVSSPATEASRYKLSAKFQALVSISLMCHLIVTNPYAQAAIEGEDVTNPNTCEVESASPLAKSIDGTQLNVAAV